MAIGVAAVILSTLPYFAGPSSPANAATDPNTTPAPPPSLAVLVPQQAADLGAAAAAANDVQQSIAVVDRVTGELVASHDGDHVFNAESILKLFTAAFYLLRAPGAPDTDLRQQLHTLIALSDNGIQSDLWRIDIIPAIAERYGLTGTSNGPNASASTWGSDRTTAIDQARFLYLMSQDPLVGPHLMSWMTATTPTGADGFVQSFGFNSLTGDHGSKQGWSDPGWTPANLHSVGWTDRYFAAILQTSPTASYATMRGTSTSTAQMLAEPAEPSAELAADTSGPTTVAADLRSSLAAVGGYLSGVADTLGFDHVVRKTGVGRLAGQFATDDAADRSC
jgi:hypothetical protein